MNIIINTFCNLHCPYCFAADVIDKYSSYNCMSEESFEEVLSFLKYNNITEVRLIGGEPTIHPKIKIFIEKIIDFGFTDIMIFTNGLFDNDLLNYFKQISKRINIHFLFNVNEPKLLGEKYKILTNNLYVLLAYAASVNIGINFYSPDQEYEYIVDLAKELDRKSIRWSLTIPNEKKVNSITFINHLNKNKKNLMHFLELCSQAKIIASQDCNALPICMFDAEDIYKILHIKPDIFVKTSCEKAVIDIAPDLKISRCFGMSDIENTITLKDFNRIEDIFSYFEKLDEKYKKIYLFSSCKNCETQKRNNNSCACLKYRK